MQNPASSHSRQYRPEALDICMVMNRMLGSVPIGTLDLLNVLAHPDVIEQTRRFLDACVRDEPPIGKSPSRGGAS